MNKYVLLKEAVTFNGAILEAGEIVELSEISAQALISEEKAVEVEPDEDTRKALEGEESPEGTEDPGIDDNTDPHLTPSNGSEDEAAKQVDLVKKALSDKYNRDPLAEAAKEVGVEFAYDARKGEIIEAVIEAGKAEVLLAK